MATTSPKSTKTTTTKPKAAKKTAAKSTAKTAKTVKTAKSATKPKTALKGTGPVSAPLAAPEPTAVAAKVEPTLVTSSAPTLKDDAMRKEQLLDAVAKRSGAKRKDCKPIVEAMLAVLGEAIGEGREINLKPLGKLKVARTKQVANGRVINMRLRQSGQVIEELSAYKDAAE